MFTRIKNRIKNTLNERVLPLFDALKAASMSDRESEEFGKHCREEIDAVVKTIQQTVNTYEFNEEEKEAILAIFNMTNPNEQAEAWEQFVGPISAEIVEPLVVKSVVIGSQSYRMDPVEYIGLTTFVVLTYMAMLSASMMALQGRARKWYADYKKQQRAEKRAAREEPAEKEDWLISAFGPKVTGEA